MIKDRIRCLGGKLVTLYESLEKSMQVPVFL